ncbi:MAG: hypothetical protein D6719_08430 [Candidatus Dadabacteria bacterium]|nr:MAG: hypothetical protein D6719_08430 [Candidatus Dadabacteria bacterium]
MRVYTKVIAILTAALALTPGSAYSQDLGGQISTFAFGLGLSLDSTAISKLKAYDLVVIDGTDATAEQVLSLKSSGAVVLGYASAGTIEKGRPWFKKLKKRFALAYWPDWDEWFVKVSSRRFRKFFIRKIAQPILAKGFDGLFLDNVDMVSQFPKETRGMKRLLKMVRRRLGFNRLLFIQNGDDIVSKFEKYIDGWNREDVTSTYDFDTKSYVLQPAKDRNAALAFVRSMKQKGFIVTTADYTADNSSQAAIASVVNSCHAGAVPFVSDILLTRLPEEPFRCN